MRPADLPSLAPQRGKLAFHIVATDLGIAHGRLDRGCPLAGNMTQIERNRFETPTSGPCAVGEVVA